MFRKNLQNEHKGFAGEFCSGCENKNIYRFLE